MKNQQKKPSSMYSLNNENLSQPSSSARKLKQVQFLHQTNSSISSQEGTQRSLYRTTLANIPQNINNEFTDLHYQTQPGYYTQGVNYLPSQESEQYHTEGIIPQMQRNYNFEDFHKENQVLMYLEESLNNSTDWINIQNVVRVTFKSFLDIYHEQQQSIQHLQQQVNNKISNSDLNNALLSKADIQDVSKAVTEVISSIDCKTEIEELRKQIQQKMNRVEIIAQFKTHQSMIDNICKQESDYRQLISETQLDIDQLREKIDDGKKDQNKKLSSIYRELEKLGLNIERKVNIDDFNERLENKADKQMVVNAACNKVNKQDVDISLSSKADIKEVDKLIIAMETKFDQEFINLFDQINRKANIEDFQYYRKELGFKLDKNELEAFRQEYVERLATFDCKINEKNLLMSQFKEHLEQKVETQMCHIKQSLIQKIDQKVESNDLLLLKQDIRMQLEKINDQFINGKLEQHSKNEQLNEKINRIHSEIIDKQDQSQNECQNIQNEIIKLKDQLKFLVKERQDDISQISELLKVNQKKLQSDMQKLEKELNTVLTHTKKDLESELSSLKDEMELKIQSEIVDKVRVEEVQDALKRLTENQQHKLETIYQDLNRSINTKNEDVYIALQKLKSDITEFSQQVKSKVTQDQLDAILNQLELQLKDMSCKADKKNTQSQFEFLNENLATLNKEMLLKASIKDIMSMLDKKSNNDEVQLDINYLKNTIQKLSKEFKSTKEEQNSLNEALCSENCVARWIWKHGQIENSNGLINSVKWDLQSVNTCPENFVWKQGQAYIQIDSPGLYEITLAFFSKKRKPLIQVLSNNEVILQSISKSVCGTCGNSQQTQANGHVQKLCNGLYKVSLIEFVVLPSKAVINVQFSFLQKSGEGQVQMGSLMNAEGFLGVRKL